MCIRDSSVPDDVFATLLDRAQTEYPNDYMQQRNILQWNSDAYAQIQALKKKHSVPDDVFAALLDKGGADYPNNYIEQRNHLNRELDAHMKANPRK